ncbi:MAG TPA: PfkB family carbohydrate kinase, partial [Thermomicrobiales bacterium]|nr:PfkB family carbohydrate kinase [Thermomicrobiales bacterium]
ERLGVAVVALTRKKERGSQGLKLSAMALDPSGEVVASEGKEIEVIDRLGGGDAFAGGFIAGYLENPENLERAVALGVAASALKHTMPGDFLCATRAEIEAATSAESAGVLQR